jgi:hypothetical protein
MVLTLTTTTYWHCWRKEGAEPTEKTGAEEEDAARIGLKGDCTAAITTVGENIRRKQSKTAGLKKQEDSVNGVVGVLMASNSSNSRGR